MTIPKFFQFPKGGVNVAHPFLKKVRAEAMAISTTPFRELGEGSGHLNYILDMEEGAHCHAPSLLGKWAEFKAMATSTTPF